MDRIIDLAPGDTLLVRVAAAAEAPPTPSPPPSFVNWFVDPVLGSDSNDGHVKPLRTLQKALDLAQPGSTIHLAPGLYKQDAITKHNGPITITGPQAAILNGNGAARIFEVNHSHYTLQGFTIDGKKAGATSTYRDKLLYFQGKIPFVGLTGAKVLGMTLKNAGGEALRLRYYVRDSEIAFCTIGPCGIHDFVQNGGGKNGEGIYVGTSSNQWADGKNPEPGPDKTTGVWIHDNNINTQGNEAVDIKEGASGILVENNFATGQKDPESAGFDSRGDNNIFRGNQSLGNMGAGFRLGGHTVGGHVYGVGNEITGNSIHDNAKGGVKVMVSPQGKICGNTTANNVGGDSVGDFPCNPTGVC